MSSSSSSSPLQPHEHARPGSGIQVWDKFKIEYVVYILVLLVSNILNSYGKGVRIYNSQPNLPYSSILYYDFPYEALPVFSGRFARAHQLFWTGGPPDSIRLKCPSTPALKSILDWIAESCDDGSVVPFDFTHSYGIYHRIRVLETARWLDIATLVNELEFSNEEILQVPASPDDIHVVYKEFPAHVDLRYKIVKDLIVLWWDNKLEHKDKVVYTQLFKEIPAFFWQCKAYWIKLEEKEAEPTRERRRRAVRVVIRPGSHNASNIDG